MTLLALETATPTCGAALLRDDNVVAEAHLHRPRIHSERLTPLIEDVLAHGGVDASALDAVAVSMGPGSYTGLRIGVSTAKGWALATQADLIGVPTLEAYAAQLRSVVQPNDVVCALLDARRDEVYAGAFHWTEGNIEEYAETKALTVDALSNWIGPVDGHLRLVGDGAEKSKDALSGVASACTMISPDDCPPSAAWVGRRGLDRIATDGPDDLASFEPFYVKDVHATPAPSPFA